VPLKQLQSVLAVLEALLERLQARLEVLHQLVRSALLTEAVQVVLLLVEVEVLEVRVLLLGLEQGLMISLLLVMLVLPLLTLPQ